MTLTYPVLNRPRQVLWLVTGLDKAEMLCRLLAGDTSIRAGWVRRKHALILADRGAADNDGFGQGPSDHLIMFYLPATSPRGA